MLKELSTDRATSRHSERWWDGVPKIMDETALSNANPVRNVRADSRNLSRLSMRGRLALGSGHVAEAPGAKGLVPSMRQLPRGACSAPLGYSGPHMTACASSS